MPLCSKKELKFCESIARAVVYSPDNVIARISSSPTDSVQDHRARARGVLEALEPQLTQLGSERN